MNEIQHILLQQYRLFNTNTNTASNTNNITEKEKTIIHRKLMIYDVYSGDDIDTTPTELWNSDVKKLEFRYNENNLRIPYFNNTKIKAIALNLDIDNIFNYISSNHILPDTQLIYGEKIQSLCDVVIGNISSLMFNPNNRFFSKEMRDIKQLDDINILPYRSIFLFTDAIDEFYEKYKNRPDILKTKIIVSHNSDGEIKTLNPHVKIHYAQNCVAVVPPPHQSRLVPLPIGIENNQWFQHSLLHKIRKNLPPLKTKDIYFYFNLNTHPTRIDCYNQLKTKLTWNTKKSKEDYFAELATHKYAICPRGNGLDTHRVWECLYLNVIPIMIEADDLHIDGLPIILLKKWDDIDVPLLCRPPSFTNQENAKITVDYYQRHMEASAGL